MKLGRFSQHLSRPSGRLLFVPRRHGSGGPTFDPKFTLLEFPEQKVFAGTESLPSLIRTIKTNHSTFKKPLIVTDGGVSKLKILEAVVSKFKAEGITPAVFDRTVPNPTIADVQGIAKSFVEGDCDYCVGIGGGGPLDAMKGGMAVIAKKKVDPTFNIERDTTKFMETDLKPSLSKITQQYSDAVPMMVAIPTTAGTGSEGGKSAVITDTRGVKFVFGNPVFFPKLVALAPELTAKMPPQLTASTGVDALFHLLEAFFVTNKAAEADGLDAAGTARCDGFALDGTKIVVDWLPKAFANGNDMEARFYMQIAALYGAKAFRKGDLGGVHATAHALGAKYHLHHGTAISRMAVPVLRYNSQNADMELTKKLEIVQQIFKGLGEKNLAASVLKFLKQLNLEIGLSGLNVSDSDLQTLAEMASLDGCQTNPIPLNRQAYQTIFEDARKF